MKPHHVVALAYDGLCTFEFGCAVEVFALERPELQVDWYRFSVCAAERGPLRAAGGITVSVARPLSYLDSADTIIIPGWRSLDAPPSPALIRKLQAAYLRGARICTICSGVFVLAASGLLDGKSATTHWRYAQTLAQRFPLIHVKPNALYVDEGQLLTAAGSAAGLDMLLHLVRRDYGAKVANVVAQRLVIAPHRLGDQAQFVPRPLPPDEAARLSKLLDWLRARLSAPHSLSSMAKRAAMSVRTLQRQFQASTGLTPLAWLIRERVGLAKELLQSSRKPIARIGELAGFGSPESFRRHFKLIAHISPSDYRAQFAAK